MRAKLVLRGGSVALVLLALGLVATASPHGPAARPAPLTASETSAVPVVAGGPPAQRGARPRLLPSKAPAHAPAPPPGPGIPLVIGSYQQVLINADRARAGLRPLSWSSCLAAVAIANARRMAAQGYISHTSGPWLDLGCRLGSQGGENVGWWSAGVNDAQLNSMFMASWDHRANILGPYHYVATAWAVGANGYAYIAVEFT